MAAIRKWLVGKNLTTITIAPCTVAADGVITVGTAKSLAGRCEGVSIRARAVTDQIMSVDDVIANNVVLYEDYEINIREILTQKTALSGNNYEPVLPLQYYTADIFKIIAIKGGKTWTVYGIRSQLDDTHEGMGKQTSSMTLLPVNVNVDATGVASITYGD